MQLNTIKAFDGMNITTKANVGESKPSILILGDMKSGKTHFWCTFPGPVVACYTDLNTQTADGFIRDDNDLTLIKIRDWNDYENKFVPAVKNRIIDAKTIVIDSYSFLSDKLISSLADSMGKITINQWGQIKATHIKTMTDLMSATQPIAGKPSYNIVVTCHLMKDAGEESDGAMVPAIAGAFKYEIGKCFGSVFVTRKLTKNEPAKDGPLKGRLVPTDPINIMYTVPPDDKHACGDGVGGKGGYNQLPTVIGNTYPELMKAWGQPSSIPGTTNTENK